MQKVTFGSLAKRLEYGIVRLSHKGVDLEKELLGCGGIRPHCKYDFFCISANFMSFLPGGHLESFVLQYFSELIQTPEAHTANGVFREAETPTQFGIRSLFLGKEKKLQQQSAAVGQFLHGLA